MPLVQTRGAASAQGFGEFAQAAVAANYIEEVFSTFLYTGNGGSQTITNNIDLSTNGGLVWTKVRNGPFDHSLYDSARGFQNILISNTTAGSSNASPFGLTALTTGFTDASGWSSAYNVATWTFRKQPKFFDIQTWTGSGSNRTISHSLGSVPGSIFVKRTDTTSNWAVYHRSLANTQYLILNATDGVATGATWWNSTTPTSSVFSLGTNSTVNASGGTYVAYIFAHNAGGFGLTGTDNVISCGSYVGNGGVLNINVGFEPQWLLVKQSSNSGIGWNMVDNMRGAPVLPSYSSYLQADLSDAEIPDALGVHFNSTGFNVDGFGGDGANGETYIYIAIRRGPMKVPTDATTVFKPLTRTGTNAAASVTTVGFAPDIAMINVRYSGGRGFVDKVRGPKQSLTPSNTGAELTSPSTKDVKSFNQNGISFAGGTDQFSSNTSGYPYVNWYIKRSPSVFDIVCYIGTGSNTTFTHNLTVVPELMIVRRRDTGDDWNIYSSGLANTEYVVLNSDAAKATGATRWNSTTPTSSVFSVGTSTTTNASAGTYVAYLFATCPSVSKVGSYSGNGSTQTINCGFGAGGARFVLIKRTDSTGDWYAYDTARGMTVLTDPYIPLNLDSSNDEVATLGSVTTVSTGFALNSTILAAINISAGTYIFLAFA